MSMIIRNIQCGIFNKLILLLFCVLLVQQLSSQSKDAQFYLYYEEYYGTTSNSENTISINYLWRSLDNNIIPLKIFREEKNFGVLANWSFRAAKLALINYPLTYYLQVFNHENGHRFRALELGSSNIEITIALPPPIEFGPSFVTYSYSNPLTQQQRLLTAVGGVEASNILANKFSRNMWLDGEIDYHSAFFYFAPANDLNFYILGGYDQENSDIKNYLQGINVFYTHPISSKIEEKLSHDQLKTYAIASIITNPYTINSAWSLIDYVFFAKTRTKLIAIPINEQIRYLPRFHFALAPYGPELIFQNHIKYKDKLFAVHLSHSNASFDNSWRIDITSWNWKPSNHLSFAGNIQIWNQPEIFYFVDYDQKSFKGIGGLFLVSVNYHIISNEAKLGLVMQFGYKTAGFSEGEQLDKTFILRGGLSFRIAND